MARRTTAEDVARQLGISRTTVSRAFDPSAYVAAETRDKILQAANALGYRRNALARALIRQKSDLVAIVSSRVDNLYDAPFFNELTHRLQAIRQWGLIVHTEHGDVDKLLSEALSFPLEAAIVRSGSVDAATIEQCERLGVPIIVTGMEPEDGRTDSVCCDNAAGARMAVEALAGRGLRKLAYLGGPEHLYSEKARRVGFIAATREFGIDVHSLTNGDYTAESGIAIGRNLLTASDRPRGIFCANDAMAIGVLNAATQELGLAVPEDLALVGFDDIPMASWPCFELTTIRNGIAPTADAVVRLLERRLANPDAPAQAIRIAPEMVRRRSA